MPREKKTKDVFELHELATLLGLPDFSDYESSGDAYSAGYREALNQGESEEQAEERGIEWERAEEEEAFRSYRNAVEGVAERLFSDHGLVLVEQKKQVPRAKRGVTYSLFKVAPEKSWIDAAAKIVDTINGVGMFEFNSLKDFVGSGPYRSPRDAVLQHLHWIKERPRVYGDRSSRDLYERAMR